MLEPRQCRTAQVPLRASHPRSIMSMCAPVRPTVTTCRLAQLPLLKDSAGTDSAAAPPAVAAAVALLPGSGTSTSLIVMVSPASGGSSSLHGTLAFKRLTNTIESRVNKEECMQ